MSGMGAAPSCHETYVRQAAKAGSWYTSNGTDLRKELEKHLQEARKTPQSPRDSIRGVLVPHAGYAYSGPTAAYSYHQLENLPKHVTTIVVLHPSHHHYLSGCAVSGASHLETPLGRLEVDIELQSEVLKLPKFTIISQKVDEAEHSGEMQYPYLRLVTPYLKVLPILCGALSTTQEEDYGRILRPILRRTHVVTVVSSDFCHWGSRFSYTPHQQTGKPIYELIRDLDHQAMNALRNMDEPGAFAENLKRTRNTVCGRHAIAVYWHSLTPDHAIDFLDYRQSSSVTNLRQSSVSYVAAVIVRKDKRPEK